MHKLIERVDWASRNLAPIATDLRIAFEGDGNEHVSIIIPAPEWMAMARHGWLLPPVEAYKTGRINDRAIGPLSEIQALEYLLQKEVPEHVWQDTPGRNRKSWLICGSDMIPPQRLHRSAWRLGGNGIEIYDRAIQKP